jgi:hypothetical protein
MPNIIFQESPRNINININSPFFSLLSLSLSQLKGATRGRGTRRRTRQVHGFAEDNHQRLPRAPPPSQPRMPSLEPRRLARGRRAAGLLRGAATAGHLHPNLGPSQTRWPAEAAGHAGCSSHRLPGSSCTFCSLSSASSGESAEVLSV